MTPVGHASISYLAGNTFREKLSIFGLIVGAIIPDVDVVFLLFGQFNEMHRSYSHSLVFVFTVSLLVMLVIKRGLSIPFLLSCFLGGILHLLVDSVMDDNPTNGIGVNLFWPFSNAYFSPFNLLNEPQEIISWDQPIQKLYASLRYIVIFELPLIIMSILVFFRDKLRSAIITGMELVAYKQMHK